MSAGYEYEDAWLRAAVPPAHISTLRAGPPATAFDRETYHRQHRPPTPIAGAALALSSALSIVSSTLRLHTRRHEIGYSADAIKRNAGTVLYPRPASLTPFSQRMSWAKRSVGKRLSLIRSSSSCRLASRLRAPIVNDDRDFLRSATDSRSGSYGDDSRVQE
ncbi:hypothetical protein C8R44DRAFT_731169 [Mycena epipterygia]|nr:hypothetical protein C8R44DRAFT_731169 [Mycena epipterygia]